MGGKSAQQMGRRRSGWEDGAADGKTSAVGVVRAGLGEGVAVRVVAELAVQPGAGDRLLADDLTPGAWAVSDAC